MSVNGGTGNQPTSATANAAPPPKEKLDPQLLKIALILVFGALASQLDSTMVNVAVGTLTSALNSTVAAVQWVITGYVLSMGLAVPLSGWAVQRYGGKKVYMSALVLFLAGSVLCSAAWNVGSLIGFRLVQGIGAGLLVPTLQTVLVQASGGRNLGRIISVIGIPALLGPILGPVLGGLIVDSLTWRWIFYVNIPVTLVALVLAWKMIPADNSQTSRRPLDLTGLLLLSPAFALLIYGIAEMADRGGADGFSPVGSLLAGALLMAAYVVYALRTAKTPVLDIRLYRSRAFLASNVTLFLSGMVMNGSLLLLPLYYQQVRGESVWMTGLLLIPQGIGMLATRSWVGGLADRIGARAIVLVSLAATIIGTIPFAFADAVSNMWLLGVAQAVRGAALNGILIPIMVSAYAGLSREQVPHASTATRILQTIGGAFGSAVLATVIAHQLAGSAAADIGAVAGAYRTAFWWSISFSLAAFVPSFFLSHRRKK